MGSQSCMKDITPVPGGSRCSGYAQAPYKIGVFAKPDRLRISIEIHMTDGAPRVRRLDDGIERLIADIEFDQSVRAAAFGKPNVSPMVHCHTVRS